MKKLIHIIVLQVICYLGALNTFAQCEPVLINPVMNFTTFSPSGNTESRLIEFNGCAVPNGLTMTFSNLPYGFTINYSINSNYINLTASWENTTVDRSAEIICTIPQLNKNFTLFVAQRGVIVSGRCAVSSYPYGYATQVQYTNFLTLNAETQFSTIACPTYTGTNCDSNNLTLLNIPNWLQVNISYDTTGRILNLNRERNTSLYARESHIVLFTDNYYMAIPIKQSGCGLSWYPDDDLDGYGNYNSQPTYSCAIPFPNAVVNNLDKCPNTYSVNYNGCETLAMTSLDKNSVETETKDIAGTVKSHSISYFNDLGKMIQNQTVDLKTNRTWASQTLYDSFGRPALNTLSAPINNYNGGFNFSNDFMVDDQNGHYNTADFETTPENPKAVGTVVNTIGWYYSNKNTDTFFAGNSNQDITSYPFSRSIYSKLNPGSVLKTIGGNKQAGEWKQGYSFTMPASHELSQLGAFNDGTYIAPTRKILKTITRDVHNNEQVLFTDTDGKTLATARVGGTNNYDNTLTISTQGYVDIHVPQGITGFTISNNLGYNLEVYDLITEQLTTISTPTLPSGFYRVAITNLDNYNPASNPVTITYKDNYYDYSLNYYDYTGRLVSSKQPLNHIETKYSYDTFGQLVYTESPDEGESRFKYRKDGQIRFSQNSKQKSAVPQEFSYTNYDDLGRPIESGVFTHTVALTFANSDIIVDNIDDPTTSFDEDGLLNSSCSEKQFTTYDYLASTDIAFLTNNLHSSYANPSFLAGNVAKTANENATTYYSYDVYGRVKWVVQNNMGLGIKTIDYEYDPITSAVTKVYFQRYTNGERFIHRYTYNTIDQNLEKVETSIDDSIYTTHANYKYYETGALKRTEIAPGTNGTPLQGIDYVYNLNGQLKSINHPIIGDSTKDPGKDTNDFFGMSISYNDHDYLRSSDFSNVTGGTNQFNGNIKGIAWNTKNTITNTLPVQYTYKYNKNNWLTDAEFNGMGAGTTTQKTITIDYVADPNATLAASESIIFTNGMNIKAVAGSTFRAQIVPETTTPFASTDYAESGIEYDANGNILRLKRNKNTENGSNTMDDLSYVYDTSKPNQLKRVQDAAGDIAVVDDIGNQTGDNYSYNSIGQLTRNNQEDINYFYNTQGLVKQVNKGANVLVKFFYNERGQRIRKESYSTSLFTLMSTDYYVLDLSGNTLAIYNKMNTGPIVQKDLPIFGQSRLGVYNRLSATSSYEITDHLGNVRAVVQKNDITGATDIKSFADYYPFGEQLPYRNSMSNYRYAFQGQEVDTELGMEAFQLRLWDGRIGRWLSPDPYGQYASPYLGMGNNPVNMIDPDGGFASGSGDPDPPGSWLSRMFSSIGSFLGITPEYTMIGPELETVVITRKAKPKNVEAKVFGGMLGMSATNIDYVANIYKKKGIQSYSYAMIGIAHREIMTDFMMGSYHLGSTGGGVATATKGVTNGLNKIISVQKQARHIAGTAKQGGGFLNSLDDAQAVLDAVHSGNARFLGISKAGHQIYRVNGVTGTNVNLGASITGQPTNVFMIKGTTSPSVVPTSPLWKP